MFKKIIAARNRERHPASKKVVLSVFRWQMVFLGAAFVFAILDLTNVLPLRANALLLFVFMALGITVAAYFDVKEVAWPAAIKTPTTHRRGASPRERAGASSQGTRCASSAWACGHA